MSRGIGVDLLSFKEFICSPASIFFVLAILILFTAVVFIFLPSECSSEGVETVETMIRRLSENNHRAERINGDNWEEEFADHVEEISNDWELPPKLLVSMMFYESSFLQGARGDNGKSWGLLQVGPQGRAYCQCGDMETAYEEIQCGACWLDAGREWCGTLEDGLTAYACGSCVSKNIVTIRKVDKRLRLAGMKETGPPGEVRRRITRGADQNEAH